MGLEHAESVSALPDTGEEAALPDPGKRPRTLGMVRSTSMPLPPALAKAIEQGRAQDTAEMLLRTFPEHHVEAVSYALTVRGEGFVAQVRHWYRVLQQTPRQERVAVPGGPPVADDGGGDDDACPVDEDPPISPNAIAGVHLWLTIDRNVLKRGVKTLPAEKVGPYRAGPYMIHPHVDEVGELVYYLAFHTERLQIEWLIGAVDGYRFAAMVPFYQRIARNAYPGSRLIEGTTADGAEEAPRLPSVVELAARGEAPWQLPLQTEPMGTDREPELDPEAARGAGTIVGLHNSHVRIQQYVKPAQEAAQTLLALVNAGQMDASVARDEAVAGRNHLMRSARQQMSPGGAAMSQALKGDGGVTVDEMVKRKVFEGFRQYIGWNRDQPMSPEARADARAALDADSPAWRASAEWLDDPLAAIPEDDAGNITRAYAESNAVYRQALAELGDSPWVSKEIIKASGRPNPEITALASGGEIVPPNRPRLAMLGFVSHNLARAGAVLGVGSMAYHVITAEEGERLHVAAQEGMSFTGGLVGAEMGQIFVATVLPRLIGAVNPVTMIVVSLVGATVGGMAGGTFAPIGTEEMSRVMLQGTRMATPAHATVAGGGLGGVMDREHRAHEPNRIRELEHGIFMLDQSLRELERRIQSAPDRTRMELLQKARLSMIRNREDMTDLLLATRGNVHE